MHGAYVLENSDIAGFSQQEQRLLAALVRTHRRGIPKTAFDAIPDRLLVRTKRTAALLRIAVLLHRSHEADSAPVVEAKANGDNLVVTLDKRWLDQRPLVRQDISGEPEDSADLGVTLRIDAA